MINTLGRQLRDLREKTEQETRSLPPEQAREVRASALARARELVENRGDGTLRYVPDQRPTPPPGMTARWRAEDEAWAKRQAERGRS